MDQVSNRAASKTGTPTSVTEPGHTALLRLAAVLGRAAARAWIAEFVSRATEHQSPPASHGRDKPSDANIAT